MNRQPLPFSLAAPWASWLQLRDAALRLVLAAFIGTLAFALTPHGSASAADPVVTSFELAAPERLTVGGRVRFLIRVEADQDTTLSLAPGGLPSVLSLTGALQTAAREANAGRVEITLQFEAAPFAVGELELPPIRLRYRSADGVTGEIVTPASRLIVESVLPDTDVLAPRDLKAQAAIGDAATPLLQLLGLALALLIVAALIVWRLRRMWSREIVEPEAEPAALSPEDQARHVLDVSTTQLGRDDYVAYYTTLAAAVRNYLTDRFGFPAFALTTTELEERMVRQGMDRWQARLVSGLLNQCDAVVYASYRPARERADADLTAAYEIVEMSRQAEPEQAEVAVT